MNTSRKTAIIVGALFIVGTVTGVLSVIFTGPILNSPDYLDKVAANENQLKVGALFRTRPCTREVPYDVPNPKKTE
jgi:hypothetical protein